MPITRFLSRALWEQGIRHPLEPGSKSHEWKGAHGYRKALKSRAEEVMRPANVELLMGHRRPTENELLLGYLKAVPLLCIEVDGSTLKKQLKK